MFGSLFSLLPSLNGMTIRSRILLLENALSPRMRNGRGVQTLSSSISYNSSDKMMSFLAPAMLYFALQLHPSD